MTSIAVWAIDIIEQHPRISLADFYEQDIASNSLGFFPHRPSLTLMVQVQRFVAKRPLREPAITSPGVSVAYGSRAPLFDRYLKLSLLYENVAILTINIYLCFCPYIACRILT